MAFRRTLKYMILRSFPVYSTVISIDIPIDDLNPYISIISQSKGNHLVLKNCRKGGSQISTKITFFPFWFDSHLSRCHSLQVFAFFATQCLARRSSKAYSVSLTPPKAKTSI